METRDIAYVVVFAAIWGTSEVVLGSWLKSLRVPFSGEALTAIAVVILVVSRKFLPKLGSQTSIAILTVVLKLVASFGGGRIGPMIAIFMEGLLFDLVASATKKYTPSRMALAGIMPYVWTFVHPFVTNPIFFGRKIIDVYLGLVGKVAASFGLPESYGAYVLLLLLILHVILGALFGMLGYKIGHEVGKGVGI